MKLVLRTFIFFLSAIALLAQQSEFVTSNDEVVLTIEHRLDGVAFSHRTKINLVKKADGKQTLVFPEKNGVFGEDVLALRRMLDTNSLYTIRIQSHYANVSSAPILSSIPVVNMFSTALLRSP